MATEAQARAAKLILKNKLRGNDWYRGIGISKDELGGYCVVVNVSGNQKLNPEIYGVPVKVQNVGEIKALGD